jgi:GNAT superfamily N-acetyltransferase
MPVPLNVRRPRAADHARMAELAGQLGYPSTAPQIAARLRALRGRRDFAVFVAEREGEIAGWLGAYVFRAVELDPTVTISGLVVADGARSGGIGRALLGAAEAWARRHGCAVISVNCNVKRRRAHGFYLKNGYAWTKTQKVFRKPL